MRPVALDRLLALLVLAMVATGLLSLRFGSEGGAWLFIVHGLLAGALAAAVGLKLRSSIGKAVASRRWGRLALGLIVSLVVAAALTAGYAWVASGRLLSLGSWTILTIHAWIGLALVPLVAVHLLPHRWRILRPASGAGKSRSSPGRMPRRAVLLAGGIGAASIALFGLAEIVDGLQGGRRRFTGSRWLPAGAIPPATTFLGDTQPADATPGAGATSSWRISLSGRVNQPLELDLAGLAAIDHVDMSAVLDCTSGWAIETAWSGTPLASILDAAGTASDARKVTIRSATGWTANLPIEEARQCLLATGVAGGDLPPANGAPVRLVAPNRRGLDWVKWVREVIVS